MSDTRDPEYACRKWLTDSPAVEAETALDLLDELARLRSNGSFEVLITEDGVELAVRLGVLSHVYHLPADVAASLGERLLLAGRTAGAVPVGDEVAEQATTSDQPAVKR